MTDNNAFFPLVRNEKLRPFIKILTDYPRDDLASDEVHQSLVTACMETGLDFSHLSVGAVPSMDTVVAGFKTAQLSLNSKLGYGHIIHTNCAPRKNMLSKKSRGERIIIGMLSNGVTLIIVNAGYTMSPFYDLVKSGDLVLFESSVRDSGSQFRSRDYFPAATAEMAKFLVEQYDELGGDKVRETLENKRSSELLKDFPLLGDKLDISEINPLSEGSVWYIDNFGNIKLNIDHDTLLELYPAGTELVLSIGGNVVNAVIGMAGFSQGEGVLALTRGSSGWNGTHYTEIFLRGSSAAGHFPHIKTGDQVLAVQVDDLKNVIRRLQDSQIKQIGALDPYMLSESKLMEFFAHKGLIQNGFDTRNLQKLFHADSSNEEIEAKLR